MRLTRALAVAGGILLAVAGTGLSGADAKADTITLRSDLWCPYNCEPGGTPPGYLIDIAKAVFEAAGAKVDYQLMPYDEAIEAVRQGKVTAVLGAARKDAPDLHFPQTSQSYSTYAFATARGSGFKYTGPDSLKGKRLGVIANYTYGEDLDAYIAANSGTGAVVTVSSEDATRDLVMLLAERKVDVIVEGDAVLEYMIKQLDLANLFELDVASDGAPIYIAFTPNDPKAVEHAKRLDAGLAELRKSGKLAEILRQYGMKDWEK